MNRRAFVLAAAATTLPLSAFGPATAVRAQDAAPLPVVATFSILGDFVQRVGGDRVALRTLVGADGDAHVYEPTPDDGRALAEAAVVFENGLGFETWLDELYEASGSEAVRVVATEGVTPLTGAEHADAGMATPEGHEGEEADREGEGEVDPHAWQDVANAEMMVAAVRDGLSAADPDGADAYAANADAYLAELRALDAEIVALTEALPEDRRKLVTSHDALGYFAARYGFEVVGTAIASVSTEASDPSAGEIAALVEAIRAAGVPAIFVENIHSPDLTERIAAEAGVALAPPLYTDALGPVGSDGDSYLGMMRHNATTIAEALAG